MKIPERKCERSGCSLSRNIIHIGRNQHLLLICSASLCSSATGGGGALQQGQQVLALLPSTDQGVDIARCTGRVCEISRLLPVQRTRSSGPTDLSEYGSPPDYQDSIQWTTLEEKGKTCRIFWWFFYVFIITYNLDYVLLIVPIRRGYVPNTYPIRTETYRYVLIRIDL